MKCRLYGRLSGPALAAVGVWDPFVAAHAELFHAMAAHASTIGLAPLAILIDPSPGALMWGRSEFPEYDDVHTRINLALACGLDAVLVVHFAKRDLDSTASDFFTAVDGHLKLAELWLGRSQSLGRGPEGGQVEIARLAEEREMRLVRLPAPSSATRTDVTLVREFLRSGRIAEAGALVGRPPARVRPDRGRDVRLTWAPGRYSAIPLDSSDSSRYISTIEVELDGADAGVRKMPWPDRAIDALAFVAGPGDASSASESYANG